MGCFGGTDGYAAEASTLFARYERRTFDDVHASILHLLPEKGSALDIGAGTGRDAAALAARGVAVTAVEPVAELREGARLLHPADTIEWVDDGLPLLKVIRGREARYDLVMATAVWMHLDVTERVVAMQAVAPLVQTDGLLAMTLRRGPVPSGRRMFHVEAGETIALAEAHGLACIIDQNEPAVGAENVAAGVTWHRLVFRR